MSRLYTICSKPDSRPCAQCNSTAYCSAECQQTDWPLYKLLCGSLGAFLVPPNPASRLAISFPWNEPRPRFIWVEARLADPSGVGESEGYDYADVTELLENHPSEGRRGFGPHRNTVGFIERESYVQVNSQSNRSINGVQGHGWKSWKGSIVVMVRDGNDLRTHRDVTLEDFRNAADYMAWYHDGIGSVTYGVGSETSFAKRIMEAKAGKVKGVRVSCQGDIALLGAEKFIGVNVPKTHPRFNIEGDDPSPLSDLLHRVGNRLCRIMVVASSGNGRVSGIATTVYISICAGRCPAHSKLKGLDVKEHLDNPMVSTLYAELEVSSEAFGETQEQWQGGVGSVLFVDRLGEDLLPGTLLDMCNFWESEVSPLLVEFLREDGQTMSKEKVLEAITLECFQQYLDHAVVELST